MGDHQARGDDATIRNQCLAAEAAADEVEICFLVVFHRTGRKVGRVRCTCGGTGATGSWQELEPTS